VAQPENKANPKTINTAKKAYLFISSSYSEMSNHPIAKLIYPKNKKNYFIKK